MLDIKFVRENPEVVKENIKKKFQDEKLVLVDKVIDLDSKIRELKVEGENLKASRNTLSKQIGQLMREKKIDVANKIKEVARENNIMIMENKPLARALYATVDIGQEIPPELYEAVAEILALVYNSKTN
jgi:seryl-tRNA synthetase